MLFSFRNQSAGHFFLKSPITPSKVKWSAPKIHQTFGQLTDSGQTYGDVITKFSRMDSLRTFIAYGAPLHALGARGGSGNNINNDDDDDDDANNNTIHSVKGKWK